MTFHVGMPVICIDTSGWDEVDYHAWNYPRLSAIGTVMGMYQAAGSGAPCLILREFANRHPTKPGFFARRFRPLVEKKTDIGFAREILRKASRTREGVA